MPVALAGLRKAGFALSGFRRVFYRERFARRASGPQSLPYVTEGKSSPTESPYNAAAGQPNVFLTRLLDNIETPQRVTLAGVAGKRI